MTAAGVRARLRWCFTPGGAQLQCFRSAVVVWGRLFCRGGATCEAGLRCSMTGASVRETAVLHLHLCRGSAQMFRECQCQLGATVLPRFFRRGLAQVLHDGCTDVLLPMGSVFQDGSQSGASLNRVRTCESNSAICPSLVRSLWGSLSVVGFVIWYCDWCGDRFVHPRRCGNFVRLC